MAEWFIGALALMATLIGGIYKRKQARPRLKVTAADATWHESSGPVEVIALYAVNTGSKALTIERAGIRLEDGTDREVHSSEFMFPRQLLEGSPTFQAFIYQPDKRAVKSEEILYGWAEDSTEKRYKSKWRPLRPLPLWRRLWLRVGKPSS